MEAVAEAASEFFVVPAGKGSRDRGGVAGGKNSVGEREGFWQEVAGFFCLEFVRGDQKHERQILPDDIALHGAFCGSDAETAEGAWRGVVGVALEFRTQLENPMAFQRPAGEFVEPVQNSEPHGDAAAKAARAGDIALDAPVERKRLRFCFSEKQIRRLASHVAKGGATTTRDSGGIIETQRDAKAVKTRTQICRSRRHTHAHAVHRGGFSRIRPGPQRHLWNHEPSHLPGPPPVSWTFEATRRTFAVGGGFRLDFTYSDQRGSATFS